MIPNEYEKLQAELSQLICNEKYKHMTSKNRDVYKDAVLACKSVVSHYKTNVEAEPRKHGRWIDMQYPLAGHTLISCSECGERLDIDSSYKSIINYCPNCGAMMDGNENR